MKAMICSNCSGTEFKRQGINYICTYCNTLYRIDGLDVSNYLIAARRALDMQDWEQAQKYYDIVELNCPSNIEAIYFSALAKYKTAVLSRNYEERKNAATVFYSAIDMLSDYYTEDDFEILQSASNRLLAFRDSALNFFDNNSLLITAHERFCFSLNKIADQYPEKANERKTLYLTVLNHIAQIMRLSPMPHTYNDMATVYIKKVREFDSDFYFPLALEPKPVTEPTKTSSPSALASVMAIILCVIGTIMYFGSVTSCYMGIFINVIGLIAAINGRRKNPSSRFSSSVMTLCIITFMIGFIILFWAIAIS